MDLPTVVFLSGGGVVVFGIVVSMLRNRKYGGYVGARDPGSVSGFSAAMGRTLEFAKKPFKFKVKKGDDTYIYDLPSKERTSQRKPDESSYWGSPTVDAYKSYSDPDNTDTEKEPEDDKKDDKSSGGLFNMFD